MEATMSPICREVCKTFDQNEVVIILEAARLYLSRHAAESSDEMDLSDDVSDDIIKRLEHFMSLQYA